MVNGLQGAILLVKQSAEAGFLQELCLSSYTGRGISCALITGAFRRAVIVWQGENMSSGHQKKDLSG